MSKEPSGNTTHIEPEGAAPATHIEGEAPKTHVEEAASKTHVEEDPSKTHVEEDSSITHVEETSGGEDPNQGQTGSNSGRGPGKGRFRFVPESVTQDYELLEELKTGGAEAVLFLCRDRRTQSLAVAKVYTRGGCKLDDAAFRSIQGMNLPQAKKRELRKHVVQIYDYNIEEDGDNWEILEYCEPGSLHDFRLRQPAGKLAEPQIGQAVQDLFDAIAFIHELNIIHKDLKPQNILVRNEEPLDLVLADFGLATEQMVSQAIRSRISGTYAYLPPEAYFGITSKQADWWAFGVILYELATGRNLFSDEEGKMYPEPEVRALIGKGGYSTEAVEDGRLRNLIDGLLIRDEENRWGAEEVKAWLGGDDPEIVRDAASPAANNEFGYDASRAFSVPGVNKVIKTPGDLNEVFQHNWQEASSLIIGASPELDNWLFGMPFEESFRQIRDMGGVSVGKKMLRIQRLLDEKSELYFRGVLLSQQSISDQIGKGLKGDKGAREWLDKAYSEGVFAAWGEMTQNTRLLEVQNKVSDWLGKAKEIAEKELPDGIKADYRQNSGLMLPLLFEAAMAKDSGIANGANISRIPKKAYPEFDTSVISGSDRDKIDSFARKVRGAKPGAQDDIPLFFVALAEADRIKDIIEGKKREIAATRKEEFGKKASSYKHSLANRIIVQIVLGAVYTFCAALYIALFLANGDGQLSIGSALQLYCIRLLPYALPFSVAWSLVSPFLLGGYQAYGVKRVVFLFLFCAVSVVPAITLDFAQLYNTLMWMPMWCAVCRAIAHLAGIGWHRLFDKAHTAGSERAPRPVVVSRFFVFGWIGVWTGWVPYVFHMVDFKEIAQSGYGILAPVYRIVEDFLPRMDFLGAASDPDRLFGLGFLIILLFSLAYDLADRRKARALAYSLAGAGALFSLFSLCSAPYVFGFLILLGAGIGGAAIAVAFWFCIRNLAGDN